MKNTPAAISVKDVSKSFRLPHERHGSIKNMFLSMFRGRRTFEKQTVLEDLSFDIKKGEFFGIVGRNGSGKSTLLKLLAGIYSPDNGSIHVNGKLTPFIELGVGFNPELTGRENVFLNGALLGFSRQEMYEMYDEIVDFAELEQFMDQKLKNYSSGMQVRLAFSIAIRARTDILLIDEVLAVGDQNFQEKCFKYFSTVKNDNKTVVFVTHDMSSVERYCDRALLIDKSISSNGIYDIRSAVAKYNQLNHPKNTNKKQKNNGNSKSGLHIKDIKTLDKSMKPRSVFNQGDELTVRVYIGKDKTVPKERKITVGLAFYDNDNVNIAGPNSLGTPLTAANDYVDFYLKSNPFNMGEYHLVVALFDEFAAQQYDISNKEISFFTNTEEVRHGKVILENRWRAK